MSSVNNYDQQRMTSTDYASVQKFGQDWAAANAAGDTAGMTQAHDSAQALRGTYGYKANDDGNGYTVLSQEDYAKQTTPTYSSLTIPESKDYSDYLKQMYQANLDSALAGYEGAYQNSLANIKANRAKIQGQYQNQQNQAAATYQQTLRNAAEYANAYGLNSGAAAQARLSTGNQYAANQASLGASEAQAMADLELERTQLANNYETQIAQAKADNDADLAKALYNEYIRLDDAAISRATAQSSLDYQTWQATYQQYQAAQTAVQQAKEELANQGWQLMQGGVMPTADQLTAMGVSRNTAKAYLSGAERQEEREAGWKLLSMGVIPEEAQLNAMGITRAQALRYVWLR